MILKIDDVSGERFAALVAYVHGPKNKLVEAENNSLKSVVSIKSVQPEPRSGCNATYNLVLDIRHRLGDGGENAGPVDRRYLLDIYEIVS